MDRQLTFMYRESSITGGWNEKRELFEEQELELLERRGDRTSKRRSHAPRDRRPDWDDIGRQLARRDDTRDDTQ
jgi:hypothetical protein